MYNTGMLKLRAVVFLFLCAACGCAINTVYEPVKAVHQQTLLVNESVLTQVVAGAKQEDVHRIMGDTLVIGYSYQNSLPPEAPYQPITIPNPYKKEVRKTPQGECAVEYYLTAVHQPDGIVSDDELMPLIFCGGILSAKGWEHLK